MKLPDLRPLADLLYPRHCLACRGFPLPRRRRWLCHQCLGTIEPLPPGACPVCSGELGPGAPVSACEDCGRLRPRFDACIAVGRYEGLLRELVVRLKYGREEALTWPLGDLLAGTVALWPPATGVDLVVPVPLSVARRIRRGFNQSERLATDVARRLRVPIRRGLLAARNHAPAQAGLSRTDRLRARRGTIDVRDPATSLAPALARLPPTIGVSLARRLRPDLTGRTVLLVDDVMTTGATASEAARVLKDAGAGEVLVAVVARA